MASSKTGAQDEDTRQLSFEVLKIRNEKLDALKLVADSVAQQRQSASAALIFHPICLSALIAVISLVHVNVEFIRTDYTAMLLTYPGIVLSYLVAVRYVTSQYIRIAEETDWPNWMQNERGVEDLVLGARFGPEIIATVILRLPNTKGRSKAPENSDAIIRAWTTKSKYRRRGLGGDMLREAVKKSKQTIGPKCSVEFAPDHANSNLLALPATFNAIFVRRQRRAEDALLAALQNWESEQNSQQ
ncbi:hypothetical protein BGZ63DRAFT_414622 [Mariannaea sp. PMI_226]|nr:hypothetical protein BGZ63DRAFT_414622 [Mariannaea sp. PMI_226]